VATEQHALAHQIRLIQEAMKEAGVWSNQAPIWIHHYSTEEIPNIWEWLQYIYLPMRLNGTVTKPHYVAPILSPYMKSDPQLNNILQLVIELDSISTTLEKK